MLHVRGRVRSHLACALVCQDQSRYEQALQRTLGCPTATLDQNWGHGGLDCGDFDFGDLESTIACVCCKIEKRRSQYSRRQWLSTSTFMTNTRFNGVCFECEVKKDPTDHCTCTRSLEVWTLCAGCLHLSTAATISRRDELMRHEHLPYMDFNHRVVMCKPDLRGPHAPKWGRHPTKALS